MLILCQVEDFRWNVTLKIFYTKVESFKYIYDYNIKKLSFETTKFAQQTLHLLFYV